MPSCAAINCCNRQFKGAAQSFHSFPHSQPELLKQWVRNMHREGFAPSKKSVVCSDHFQPSCFDRTGQTVRLRTGSVPTLLTLPDHLLKTVKSRNLLKERLQQDEASMTTPRSELCTPSTYLTVILPEKDHFHSVNDSPSSMNTPRSELCTPSTSSTVVLPEKDHLHLLNDSPSSLKRKSDTGLGKTLSTQDHFSNISETQSVKKYDIPLLTTERVNQFMNITETLVKFRERGFLCDVVLVAKCGREVKAHSVLLAAVSPVFLMAIEEKPSSGTYHLCFPEVELDVLEIAVHFVYTGKLLLPTVYSQLDQLSMLFNKLSDLGLSLHKLHGCEMTFERNAKKPQSSTKSAKARDADNKTSLNDSVPKLKASCKWNEDKKASSADGFNEGMIIGMATNDARRSETRGISVESTVSTLDKEKGQGNREPERPGSKYRWDLLKNGKHETMPCNALIRKGIVAAKPIKERAAGALHSSITGSQELNNVRSVLLLDQTVGELDTLDSDSYGTHETIVDDNGETNLKTHVDNLILVEPSLTEKTLQSNDADKLSDKANVSSEALMCEHCKEPNAETFATEIELLWHKINFHYDLFNKCNYCGRRLSSREGLWLHIKRHLGLDPRNNHKCNDCGLHFAAPDLLKRHRQRHTGEKPHECSYCKKQFTLLGSMKRHRLVHTGYHPFLCDFCGKGFSRTTGLMNHVTLQHEFICALCGCKQTSKADMEKHALEVHQLGQVIDFNSIIKNPKTYLCDLCGRNCISANSLQSHMKKHRKKPFHCEICGDKFSESHELRLHMSLHTGEQPFVCDVCQKGFTQKSTLMMHLAIHSGINACVICSKSFATKGHLKQHIKQHTMRLGDKKQFMCEICSNQFTSKGSLVYHSRIHSGERPYKCGICSKQLISKTSLTHHMRTHTGDKPYACTVCKKSFRQSQHLNSHMRTHTGERPFICEVCSKSYKQKIDLRHHFVNFHRIDVPLKLLSKGIELNGKVKVPDASDSSGCIVDELEHELDN